MQAATERMRGVRERVATRLEQVPVESPGEGFQPTEESWRALDRVREMVQDAIRKGERLAAAAERGSRAAERILRRVEEETRDMEGLVVRLSPAETWSSHVAVQGPENQRTKNLTVLDSESDLPSDDAPGLSREKRP
jgi:hypothetical protein